ncbi:5-oxoprolinase subunit PxpB [Rhodanobacter aciditrophus]|uniref:5-oxoprolinase subunit PxpB n=1 Tax=Rhodanobacter aciditrophus TaxID=1623218 RepID=A0ABW4B6G9_9GAMM
MMYPTECQFLNSQTCFFEFSKEVDEAVSEYIASVVNALEGDKGIVDVIASYTTLMVVFDPYHYDRHSIAKRFQTLFANLATSKVEDTSACDIEIPVFYDPEVGPDLLDVAKRCNLTPEEVIAIHSGRSYRAYAIGFMPGYAYLGTLDERIQLPRRDTPRLKVAKGMVAFAEKQTAVYPSESPGGWHLVGRTPIELVDWGSESLSLMKVGDRIHFKPITRDDYLAMGGKF